MIQTHLIRENIYSFKAIGYLDLDFHGCIFRNEEGASYNAYLIIDEQITLIDLVDAPFMDEFSRRLKEVLGERKIDNIIINHVEPDHSGGFELLKEVYPDAKCYCSAEAKNAMLQMFFKDHSFTKVEHMGILKTGSYSFVFVLTPFIHWPDNMLTYLQEERILFSNDAFGSLVNSNLHYDDEYEYTELIRQTKEYYANIVQPCSRFVEAKLAEILSLNLAIDLICPAHGIIWRSHIPEILEQYMRWAKNGDMKDKVVIVYDTIWDNTEMMTNEIAVGIAEQGYEVRVYNASKHRKSLIMTEIMDARGILIGSSNFNNTMTPQIADVLERIIGLKPLQKVGMAYGSYGWADVHLNRIEHRLKEANVQIVEHALYENYTPNEAQLLYAKEVGKKFGAKLKELKSYE
ncbi:MAG: FprA family A-type flavoprotein [Culicoidibacterales bacterium]